MRKRSPSTAWYYILAHGVDLLDFERLWDEVRAGRGIQTVRVREGLL